MRACVPLTVAMAALTLCLSACSSDKGSASGHGTTSTPGSSTGAAKITSFVVPASIRCGAASSTNVQVSYATVAARTRQLVVDGLPFSGATPANATVTARVHCDGVEHTVALIALDGTGRRTSQVRYLRTVLPNP